MEANKQLCMAFSNRAQTILFLRCKAIIKIKNHSSLTDQFSAKAKKFRELKKLGFNYIKIDELLRRN